jgi:hypothetical protein
MKTLSFTLTAILLWSSCTQEETAPAFEDKPVIEAYLIAGDSLQLRISRQVAFSSDATLSADNLDSLHPQITINTITTTLTPIGNGSYYLPGYILQPGDECSIIFSYNGKSVSAQTIIPTLPVNFSQSITSMVIEQISSSSGPPSSLTFPDPLELNWSNPNGSYYLVVAENIEVNPDPVRDFGDEEPPAAIFRNEPTQASSYAIQSQSFSYYGTHRIILHHINPEYANLYDDSGSSSQNLTTPNTGIENGLGIFTGISSDTLLFEVSPQ